MLRLSDRLAIFATGANTDTFIATITPAEHHKQLNIKYGDLETRSPPLGGLHTHIYLSNLLLIFMYVYLSTNPMTYLVFINAFSEEVKCFTFHYFNPSVYENKVYIIIPVFGMAFALSFECGDF